MRAPPSPTAPCPGSPTPSRAFTQQTPKGTISGYKMNKQKPSTRIYSVPLPLPARPRCESGLGVCPAPQNRLQRAEPLPEGTVLGVSASTRGCQSCTLSPIVQQDLPRACWPSAGRVVLRDGTSPWDTHALYQDRRTSVSCCDLLPAAERPALHQGLGLLLTIFS